MQLGGQHHNIAAHAPQGIPRAKELRRRRRGCRPHKVTVSGNRPGVKISPETDTMLSGALMLNGPRSPPCRSTMAARLRSGNARSLTDERGAHQPSRGPVGCGLGQGICLRRGGSHHRARQRCSPAAAAAAGCLNNANLEQDTTSAREKGESRWRSPRRFPPQGGHSVPASRQPGSWHVVTGARGGMPCAAERCAHRNATLRHGVTGAPRFSRGSNASSGLVERLAAALRKTAHGRVPGAVDRPAAGGDDPSWRARYHRAASIHSGALQILD